jgi:hypothetical protein
MRRAKLNQLIYTNYPACTQEEKDIAQELVFQYYYDRNDMDIDIALEEIEADLMYMEQQEQFERCQLLKDVLDRFE